MSAEPPGQMNWKSDDLKFLAHSGPWPGEKRGIFHEYKAEDCPNAHGNVRFSMLLVQIRTLTLKKISE